MFGDKLELAVMPEQAKARVFEIFNAAAKQRDALCTAQTGSGNVNPAFKPSLRHVTG
jgi:hypothetical protein